MGVTKSPALLFLGIFFMVVCVCGVGGMTMQVHNVCNDVMLGERTVFTLCLLSARPRNYGQDLVTYNWTGVQQMTPARLLVRRTTQTERKCMWCPIIVFGNGGAACVLHVVQHG